jgi:hypothetical protein
MSDTINALQMLNQPRGGGQLPAPVLVNPLAAQSAGMGVAGQVYNLRAQQGQQLWGQALQQATDPQTGTVDYQKAQGIAAGMGPAAAMAAATNLRNTTDLRGQQIAQASGLYSLIGQASASLMRDPSDANIENIRGSLSSAGAPPSALAELDRIKSIQAPAGRVTEAYNHNLAAMDAQTRLATGGFPQMQGQNVGNQIVPMGGVPASPYSRGGLVTGQGAVPTTMAPGEGGMVSAVVRGPNGPVTVQIPYQQAFPGQVSPAAGVPPPGTIPPNPNAAPGTPPGRLVPIPANPALRNPNAPTPPATTTTPTPPAATGAPTAPPPPNGVFIAPDGTVMQGGKPTLGPDGKPFMVPRPAQSAPAPPATSTPAPAPPAAAPAVPTPQPAPAPAPPGVSSPVIQTPAGPGVVTSLPIGQQRAAEEAGGQSAAMGSALTARADQVPTNKANYANMLGDLTRIGTMPPGGEREVAINTFLQKATGYGFTMTPDQVAAANSFAKLANIAVGQQLAAIGGTDARQALFMGANPNLDLSKLGNTQIIHMLQGNEDAIQAKARAWQDWQADPQHGPQSYAQFQNDFNHHFDPRVFQQQYMGPSEIAALRKSIAGPGEAQKFLDDVKYARSQGWIQ